MNINKWFKGVYRGDRLTRKLVYVFILAFSVPSVAQNIDEDQVSVVKLWRDLNGSNQLSIHVGATCNNYDSKRLFAKTGYLSSIEVELINEENKVNTIYGGDRLPMDYMLMFYDEGIWFAEHNDVQAVFIPVFYCRPYFGNKMPLSYIVLYNGKRYMYHFDYMCKSDILGKCSLPFSKRELNKRVSNLPKELAKQFADYLWSIYTTREDLFPNHLIFRTEKYTKTRLPYELATAYNACLLYTSIVIVSLAIILGLSVGVFFYRLNNKDKKLQFVRQQQKADESIYQLILEKNSIKLKTKKAVYSKIAKDIHDGIVNGIFTIRFNLQQLGTDNENLKSRLIKELENLEKTTRDISHALADNEIFKEVNFSGLVEELVGMQKNKWQTKFVFHQDKKVNLEKLSAIKKINIYYIIREAIQNVNKYAHASECFISITHNSDGVFIQIQDNGIGFDPLAVNNGLGLKNMKERATVLKSKLYIDTVKDKGTKVSLELKL